MVEVARDRLSTEAYWVVRPRVGELRSETIPGRPRPGTTLLRAHFTAVSPGTERLVGSGRVPASCAEAMACRSMEGSFALPLKYGYGFVGRALDGAHSGRRAFVMHPHQTLARVRDEHLTLLPESLPSRRATLIPNLETALNAVWDGEWKEGERCLVFGAGPVGLLVAYVLHRLHGLRPQLCELDAERAEFAAELPWIEGVLAPEEVEPRSADLAFHATGAPDGLNTALKALDFEGRVIELSWYGERPVSVELGTHFHYLRQRIIASQVSSIAPTMRSTHGFSDRLRVCVELLDDAALESLLDPVVPFREMPAFMHILYEGRFHGALPVIAHGIDEERA